MGKAKGIRNIASKLAGKHNINKESLTKMAMKSIIKDDKKGARLANLYTGKKINETPSVLSMVGIGVAGLAISGGGSVKRGIETMGTNNNEMNTLNSIKANLNQKNVPSPMSKSEGPMSMADGYSDKTLGADGSMVFGMHNKRHG